MRPSQSVAARESRLWSRAWMEASRAARKSKPAARCGQNREIFSSQSMVAPVSTEAMPGASLTNADCGLRSAECQNGVLEFWSDGPASFASLPWCEIFPAGLAAGGFSESETPGTGRSETCPTCLKCGLRSAEWKQSGKGGIFSIYDIRYWLPKPATRWMPQITLFAGANCGRGLFSCHLSPVTCHVRSAFAIAGPRQVG